MTRKMKVLAALFLAVLLAFSAAGCGDREGLGLVKQAVRFKDNYKTDAMEVFCDWDAVNPFLDACEYEKYGLQTGFVDDKTFRYYEEEFNVIWLSEDLPTLVNHEKILCLAIRQSLETAECCQLVWTLPLWTILSLICMKTACLLCWETVMQKNDL